MVVPVAMVAMVAIFEVVLPGEMVAMVELAHRVRQVLQLKMWLIVW